ncbi:hypothetical protein [Pseudomonas bananamidigenes]|uniref:hypothetical protein n=1 Tax=Pseudomonas bananamidigenes TaxID=2843610 RepID=UPI00080336B8|nr:hypothetical protein [Pseudomonas bananamidigenes]
MHAQNTIILICLALGLVLLGYFIRKIILRALARSYDAGLAERNSLHSRRITALNTDLTTITQLRNQEAQQLADLRTQMHAIKATPFTATDYRDLTKITQFLALALQTWKALKGTEASQAKAEQLIKVARALAHRVYHTVETAKSLNGQPLDTLLIEWLNQHGTFSAAPELSSISFPHEADTEGYQHLRDALREAMELNRLPAEDAA